MKYVYKNEADRPVNIGGYQFADGQELLSNIIIEQFKEAVSNKFLSLKEISEVAETAQKIDSDEEARKAAEAEAVKRAEDIRLAAKTEKARLDEEAVKAEEARLAEGARLADEARKTEEARFADEEVRKAAEAEAVKKNKK